MNRNSLWGNARRAARRTAVGIWWAASALSLVLCLAAAALWVRGGATVDTVVWRTGYPVGEDWQRTEYMTRSLHGRVVFWHTGRLMTRRELGNDPAAAHAKLENEQVLRHWSNESRMFNRAWPAPAPGFAGVLGFRWQDAVVGTSGKFGIALPFIVAVSALLPLVHLTLWGRARWRADRDGRRAGQTPPQQPPQQRGPQRPGSAPNAATFASSHSSVPAAASRGI